MNILRKLQEKLDSLRSDGPTDDDINQMHSWSISSHLAALPPNYLEQVPPEVAALISEAKGLHPEMARGAEERAAAQLARQNNDILLSRFLTEWEYDRVLAHGSETYHVWRCLHQDGYAAYQLTGGDPTQPEAMPNPPTGTGHFMSIEALFSVTGITPQGRLVEDVSFADELLQRGLDPDGSVAGGEIHVQRQRG